jgi:hypothetical protein
MLKRSRMDDSPTKGRTPWLIAGLPSILSAGRLIYLLWRSGNARAARPFGSSKLLEANMKNRFERAGVTDAFANLLSELKHDLKDTAKSKGADARESLAGMLDDVAEKMRTNTHRVSSRLRHTNDSGSNMGKVALVLGIAGLVGVLFSAGAAHDDASQSNT